jgi:signal transduction histidine kinase
MQALSRPEAVARARFDRPPAGHLRGMRAGRGDTAGSPPRSVRVTLPRHMTAPRKARHVLARLAGLSQGSRELLALLASEVVANAVVHGEGEEIELRATTTARGFLLVAVESESGGGWPHVSSDPRRGFGLRFVQQVALRWGTERVDDRTVVWFFIAPDLA